MKSLFPSQVQANVHIVSFQQACDAISKGNFEQLKVAVDRCPQILRMSKQKWSLLHFAVGATSTPSLEIVTFLLKKMDSGTINSPDCNNVTALYWACKLQWQEVVKVFLKEEAYDEHPIFKACRNSEGMQVVSFLLSCNCEINIRNSDYSTPLLVAAEHGQKEIVECLIQNGADVNLFNSNYDTPLYVATREGHTELVKHLIKNGATTNFCHPKTFDTALHAAAMNGHSEIVWSLLDNLSLQLHSTPTNDGDTPSLLAYNYGNYLVGNIIHSGVVLLQKYLPFREVLPKDCVNEIFGFLIKTSQLSLPLKCPCSEPHQDLIPLGQNHENPNENCCLQ
jgi:hypothetical protein